LEISLGVITNGALFGGFGAVYDMTAVTANPNNLLVFLKYSAVFNIF